MNNPVGVAWWRRRQKVALASGVVSAPLATSEGHWLRGRGPRQTTIGLGIDHFVTVITSVEATGAVSNSDRTADEPYLDLGCLRRWAARGQSVRVPSGSPAANAAKAAGDSHHASRPYGYLCPVLSPRTSRKFWKFVAHIPAIPERGRALAGAGKSPGSEAGARLGFVVTGGHP